MRLPHSWFAQRWGSSRSVVIGVAVLAAAFLPLMLVRTSQKMGTAVAASALLASAARALGTAAIFPFEMDTVVALAGGRLVATHYGFYNTVVGVGILLGNLGTGVVFGIMRDAGSIRCHTRCSETSARTNARWLPILAWVSLTALGAGCGGALHLLQRSGQLDPLRGIPMTSRRPRRPVRPAWRGPRSLTTMLLSS